MHGRYISEISLTLGPHLILIFRGAAVRLEILIVCCYVPKPKKKTWLDTKQE